MKLHSTVVLGLVAYVAAISIRHQSGPVEPDTDPDCSYYNTVFSASDNCAYLEDFWGVSHAEFVSWVNHLFSPRLCITKASQNPSVKSDCSGIKIGNSYCVEVTRKPKPTSSKPTSTSSPTPTKSPKPSPTQDGLTDNCTSFYFAVKDDNCQKIVKKYGTFTVTEFISWVCTTEPRMPGNRRQKLHHTCTVPDMESRGWWRFVRRALGRSLRLRFNHRTHSNQAC